MVFKLGTTTSDLVRLGLSFSDGFTGNTTLGDPNFIER